jgi:hypothetical protein
MKYAFANDMPGEHAKWTLNPWRQRGLEFFKSVQDIPEGYCLISSHHPPWREPLRSWIAQGRPWIEIEYGYWGPDTPRRETRRVTYCGHHNMQVHSVPHSRSHLFPNPPLQPWRESTGTYIIGIQPVDVVLAERTGESMDQFRQRITDAIAPYWSGSIVWRKKMGAKHARFQTFQEQLVNAHAVVGERTMACVESCLLGIPAYTIDNSMTTLLMGDVSNLKNVQHPDRTAWWEHIAWSQFNRNEFDTTAPCDLVEQYQILPR